MLQDSTAEKILMRLGDLKNYPDEDLAPYRSSWQMVGLTTSPLAGSFIAKMSGLRG